VHLDGTPTLLLYNSYIVLATFHKILSCDEIRPYTTVFAVRIVFWPYCIGTASLNFRYIRCINTIEYTDCAYRTEWPNDDIDGSKRSTETEGYSKELHDKERC
jgi:hypothetical protein